MKRAALLLMLAGCVDLSAPRAYQCDPQGLSLEEAVRQSNCRSTKSSTWYCALDGFCRDVTKPSTRECEADVHCPAQHRCLPTEDSMRVLRCRPVDQEGAFRCRPDAGDSDCGPASRCSFEGVCRPREARAFTCRPDAGDVDCEGGWRCGLEAVCRVPVGGPNRCATDFDCDEGWRCGGERCVDPRDEQLFPLVAPRPLELLNPLVDFFGDGGGQLLVSPPVLRRDVQTRLVLREGHELYVADQSAEQVLVKSAGFRPRLRPGWKATLGPAGLLQTSGTQFELTLATDGGSTLVDLGQLITSARALAGPGLEGAFGFTVEEGLASAAALSTGHETVFLPDSGVRLQGMTGSPALGCGPAFVTWSANTLYLVKADGGFSGTSLVKGTELERTTIEALVDTTSSLVAKRTILDVQTGEGAFAVVYQQAAQVAPLDSDAGVDARGMTTRIAAFVPKGCGLEPALLEDVEACPNAAGAKLTAVWPSVDARGLEVLRVCGNGAFEWRYARDQVLGGARAVLAQSPGSFAAAQRSGVLSLGAGPRSVVGLTAAEPIQTVFEASGHTLFTGESSYSSPSRLGLETSFSTRAQGNLIRAWVPFGRMTTVLRNGVVLDRDADGGLIFLAGTPEGTPPVSDAALVPPALLAVTAGDSLWTITLDPMMPSLLQVRARPVPGFPITSLALRPHRSQGAFEGYLISASRLFSVDAPSLNRVNLSEVALEQDDPVQVWFDGPPGASRGRLLLRSGALRSLPGLLVLAPGVGSDEAIEARSVCSSTVQLTSTGLFQLDSPDGGTGVWRRVDALGSDAGLSFEFGRLVPMDGGAVVSFPGGAAWRVPSICR